MTLDRREFLLLAAVSALSGGCASMTTVPVTPVANRIRLDLGDYPALARPGGSLMLRPAGLGTDVYVLSLDDGGYAAVSPICKHQGCTVDIEGPRLVCPCHGSMYGRDGRVLRGPTQHPLDRFPTDLSPDGVLTIQLAATS